MTEDKKMVSITSQEARAAFRMLQFAGLHDLAVDEMRACAAFLTKVEPMLSDSGQEIDENEKIDEVLLSSGECEISAEVGKTFRDVLDAAGNALDGASCNTVVVVRAGGKFFIGEFAFDFREVQEAEARQVAEDFGME